jgi:hypothetical protein
MLWPHFSYWIRSMKRRESERVGVGQENYEGRDGAGLDEREFLSPHGIRSLSRVHEAHPYVLSAGGERWEVRYVPAESDSGLFGGNSNWRGPVWMPVNYLLMEALERYHHFYGDSLRVECPTGSGRLMNLGEVASEIARRLTLPFVPAEDGRRPCHGPEREYAESEHFRELVLFHEYFHGETGRGLGASHQTGWTALVVRCLEDVARTRSGGRTLFPPYAPFEGRERRGEGSGG